MPYDLQLAALGLQLYFLYNLTFTVYEQTNSIILFLVAKRKIL